MFVYITMEPPKFKCKWQIISTITLNDVHTTGNSETACLHDDSILKFIYFIFYFCGFCLLRTNNYIRQNAVMVYSVWKHKFDLGLQVTALCWNQNCLHQPKAHWFLFSLFKWNGIVRFRCICQMRMNNISPNRLGRIVSLKVDNLIIIAFQYCSFQSLY